MTEPTYSVGILQIRAYKVLQEFVANVLKKFELKPTHWFILGYVSQHGSATSATIANLLKVEPPLLTLLTEELIKKQLIQKKDHPSDGRVKLLCLTPRAEKLIPEVETELQNSLRPMFKGLSDEQMKTYKRVLEVIVANDE